MEKEKVTLSDVEHVAKLSRLEFSDEEKAKVKNNLNDIVNYFSILSEVKTEGIEAVNKPEGELRKDEVIESMQQSEIVRNAPHHTSSAFVVPRVVE